MKGESSDFHEVLEQVLGLGSITREGFFKILEDMQRRRLSTQEFFRLLEIIARQERKLS